MSARDDVLADLAAEGERLDGWLSGLDDDGWSTITTAEGWTVAHQVAHLTWTDRASLAAVAAGEEWEALVAAAQRDPAGFVDGEAERLAVIAPESLLHYWRDSRDRLARALADVPDGQRIVWFGPPMSPASMATARLMETWAHGLDVAEAVGIEVEPTDRSRHVAHLGVRTRGFAYAVRGESDPGVDIRVELQGPSGDMWTWGPADAAERVTGSAHDFALLATRRRHRDDVDVRAVGPHADHWLDVVQAFAGPPGRDPERRGDRSTNNQS